MFASRKIRKQNEKKIKAQVSHLDYLDKCSYELKNKDMPIEKRRCEQSNLFFEASTERDILREMQTRFFIEENENLRVSLPTKDDESEHWDYLSHLGRWALTDKGFEELEIRYHEAKMRRLQLLQAKIGPFISVAAIIISLCALLVSIIFK